MVSLNRDLVFDLQVKAYNKGKNFIVENAKKEAELVSSSASFYKLFSTQNLILTCVFIYYIRLLNFRQELKSMYYR